MGMYASGVGIATRNYIQVERKQITLVQFQVRIDCCEVVVGVVGPDTVGQRFVVMVPPIPVVTFLDFALSEQSLSFVPPA